MSFQPYHERICQIVLENSDETSAGEVIVVDILGTGFRRAPGAAQDGLAVDIKLVDTLRLSCRRNEF